MIFLKKVIDLTLLRIALRTTVLLYYSEPLMMSILVDRSELIKKHKVMLIETTNYQKRWQMNFDLLTEMLMGKMNASLE